MNSTMIGELPEFDGTSENWEIFNERLEQYFEINNIGENKRKAMLLTTIGEGAYKTLRDICHPTLPKNKTYDELCSMLKQQFVVKTSVFRERQKFYSARQYTNESVSNWFARLKKLSVDCKFGEKLDQILVDRFMSGLQPSPILDRLCEEDKILPLQQTVDLAIHKESAIKGNCL